MQQAYINALYELAEEDPRVISLLSDSGTEYDEFFLRDFPHQCLNFGIAEQTSVAAAAGLADSGKIPFVYTSGAFLAYRSLEFIRDCVCMKNANVKIVGAGSGLSWSTLGPTHHTTEDIAALCALPNLVLLSPSSPRCVHACVKLAHQCQGPVYLRIGLKNEKELFSQEPVLELGKNQIVRDGKDAVLFSTGSILSEGIVACEELAQKGMDISIHDVVSLRPFDLGDIFECASKYKFIITLEEHCVTGGLGTIISDALLQTGKAPAILKIGVDHGFAEGYGTVEEVRQANRLDAKSLCERIGQWIKNQE